MARTERRPNRKHMGEPGASGFLQREAAGTSSGGARRQARSLRANDDLKLLEKPWTIRELNPERLAELEAAWERQYGPLPPIRHLKRNVPIKPSRINLEEYDEEAATDT